MRTAPGDSAKEEPSETVSTTPGLEILASRVTDVGGLTVRRALPKRGRRTVGAWCFADHLGPASVTDSAGVAIGPHPHIGLQTVTWLLAGTQLHRDSLGSEQLIRPGQLNLMTSGHGIAHAEESLEYRGLIHGVQLWVALPEATRHGSSAFEHHADLPHVELDAAIATVLVGSFGQATSPARTDTPLVGVDLDLRPGTTVFALQPTFEHALIVCEGSIAVGDQLVGPGMLGYLGLGRDELAIKATEPARVLLIGGEPFEAPVLMWWNFVGRDWAEIARAREDWQTGGDRFAKVRSEIARIPAPAPTWSPSGSLPR